jgi:hypothetical protein
MVSARLAMLIFMNQVGNSQSDARISRRMLRQIRFLGIGSLIDRYYTTTMAYNGAQRGRYSIRMYVTHALLGQIFTCSDIPFNSSHVALSQNVIFLLGYRCQIYT